MTRTLTIFQKHLRHLWPHAAAVLILMALSAVLDPTLGTGEHSAAYDLLVGLALPAACWNLIIASIHEEKLPGDRQYWLTRPFRWQELLAAKALFVAAFVNLPLFVWHLCALRAAAVPLGEHLPALIWRQVFFTALYILPVAGLAAITRNLGQVIVTALWAILPVFPLVAMLAPRHPLNGFAATVTAAPPAVIAIGVGLVLWLQYSRRSTRQSRMVICATMLAVVMVQVARAHLPASVRSQAGGPVIRISIDPSPGRHSTLPPVARPDLVTYDIPLRVERSASALDLVPDSVTLLSAAGTTARFHDLVDGAGWLTIERRGLGGSIPNLRATAKFLAFAHQQVLPLPRGQRVIVPRVGSCQDSRDSLGMIVIVCYSPDPLASVRIGASRLRLNWIIPQGMVDLSIPTASGFPPLTRFTSLLGYRSWEDIGDQQLVAAEPRPPVEVSFDLSATEIASHPAGRRY